MPVAEPAPHGGAAVLMGFHLDACCSFIMSTPPMSRIVNSKRSSQGASRCSQSRTTLSGAPFANRRSRAGPTLPRVLTFIDEKIEEIQTFDTMIVKDRGRGLRVRAATRGVERSPV